MLRQVAARTARTAVTAARPARAPRHRMRALAQRYASSSDAPAPVAAPMTTTPDAPAATTPDAKEGMIPGTEHGGRRLAIIFTCTVCDTRSAKKFSEHSYRNGVVIVRCPGCRNRCGAIPRRASRSGTRTGGNNHLIADNLGFFEDDRWDVEKLMRERGEDVNTIDDDNLLAGIPPERLQELILGAKQAPD